MKDMIPMDFETEVLIQKISERTPIYLDWIRLKWAIAIWIAIASTFPIYFGTHDFLSEAPILFLAGKIYGFVLFFGLLPILICSEVPIREIKEAISFELRRIESEKFAINGTFNRFLNSLEESSRNENIDVVRIMEISSEIKSLTNRMETISKLVSKLKSSIASQLTAWNWLKYHFILIQYSDILREYSQNQAQWMKNAAAVLASGIEEFIRNHNEALKKLRWELNEQEKTVSSESWIWALELQKARLEAHIENLEKIRIRA